MAKIDHDERKTGTRPHTEDLETLLAVVDHGGLGAAARALGLPKSTLSRRLDRLEATLGVQLLARSRGAVRPTDEATRVLERVREALADIDGIAASARGDSVRPRGRLRVSAPADLAAYPEVWLSFMQAFPEVEVQVELTNRYVDVVREGFDLALRGGRGDDEALISRRIGSYPLRAVATPAWVAENGVLEAPKALRSTSCVLLQPFRGVDRPPPGTRHLVLNQMELVHAACLRGLGVAVLPAPRVADDLAAGRLQTVLAAYDPLEVPLYAAFAERRFLPASTLALLDHLAAAFGAPDRSAVSRSRAL